MKSNPKRTRKIVWLEEKINIWSQIKANYTGIGLDKFYCKCMHIPLKSFCEESRLLVCATVLINSWMTTLSWIPTSLKKKIIQCSETATGYYWYNLLKWKLNFNIHGKVNKFCGQFVDIPGLINAILTNLISIFTISRKDNIESKFNVCYLGLTSMW